MKFDQQKTKHQLFHLSISLATVLVCMTYMQFHRNWANVGNLWNSLIVPIVFTGELLKVVLARYYSRADDNALTQQQRQKRASYLTIREICGGLLLQFICTLLYAFVCIILGAPVLQNYEQTFVLALLLTLQTASPTVFLLGAGGALQVCFCEKPDTVTKSEETALGLFKYNAVGGILGAWAGSVVAPLDWDRDWQAYPIPNVVGALLGCALESGTKTSDFSNETTQKLPISKYVYSKALKLIV
ncbi:glycosylphosphatidylinositol anchor biosynthesis protein 11-like [Rhagoletis pomonella]|uniref:glycosylphosphatidylinositol anchor biosynthesis protein 11-like n=1 Tax=Rhagoletis pomonella TaxID=28610 RepID=UPI00177BD384|nr:glycosylphosphatidylinositol anchor biosynthesis protein 11-like [Rhagoletis pomonella]